jgi:hypothetical protein
VAEVLGGFSYLASIEASSDLAKRDGIYLNFARDLKPYAPLTWNSRSVIIRATVSEAVRAFNSFA